MKSTWRSVVASGLCVGMFAMTGLLGGCVVRAHGPAGQVEIVDSVGYHHQGYYDEHHDWHGGYYDEHHAYHDDPHDWHN